MSHKLSERQQAILQCIVGEYIDSAMPVGSRYIALRHNLDLSPATIRNVMADLEEMGYLSHPHVSAGRMPTSKAYRFYVDTLMEIEELSDIERRAIERTLKKARELEELLTEASRILGKISHQLSLVFSPAIRSATLERLELINASSSKIAVILSVKSGIVRTIIMEVSTEIRREKLDSLSSLLNERLTGHTLEEIRATFQSRVKDIQNEETGVIRLLMKSSSKVFDDVWTWRNVHIGGTTDVIHQPEFEDPKSVRSFISLVNDEKIITRLFAKRNPKPGEVTVRIGEEHQEERMKSYSTITSAYRAGDAVGTVGVIGPTRMSYSRMIPLVDYMARTLSAMLS